MSFHERLRPGFSLLLTLLLALPACSGPGESGLADAAHDIAAGTLRLKSYGLPAAWHPEYARLMKQRFGVTVQGVAGCDVNKGLRRSVDAYNERMEREIIRRFGLAAYRAIEAEAQQAPGGR